MRIQMTRIMCTVKTSYCYFAIINVYLYEMVLYWYSIGIGYLQFLRLICSSSINHIPAVREESRI